MDGHSRSYSKFKTRVVCTYKRNKDAHSHNHSCSGKARVYILCVRVCSLIVVRRFVYASDPESYTSGSIATGRASLAGQVNG
jgi:hypothetical protein